MSWRKMIERKIIGIERSLGIFNKSCQEEKDRELIERLTNDTAKIILGDLAEAREDDSVWVWFKEWDVIHGCELCTRIDPTQSAVKMPNGKEQIVNNEFIFSKKYYAYDKMVASLKKDIEELKHENTKLNDRVSAECQLSESLFSGGLRFRNEVDELKADLLEIGTKLLDARQDVKNLRIKNDKLKLKILKIKLKEENKL